MLFNLSSEFIICLLYEFTDYLTYAIIEIGVIIIQDYIQNICSIEGT